MRKAPSMKPNLASEFMSNIACSAIALRYMRGSTLAYSLIDITDVDRGGLKNINSG